MRACRLHSTDNKPSRLLICLTFWGHFGYRVFSYLYHAGMPKSHSKSHVSYERLINGGEVHEKISTETTSTSMANVLTDVLRARTDDPLGYGLGYSIFYYYNNKDMFYATKTTLKLLAIDGVNPSDETIADGSYPLSNNSYVVLRADTPKGAPARRMAEFMLTPSDQQCVTRAGYGPLIAGE